MLYTYASALRELGKRDRKKLCNHTYLIKYNDRIGVQLWSTDVVTLYPDGSTELETGGWNTATTWDRISSFSEYCVRSIKGVRTIRGKDGLDYLFESGMIFKADGSTDACPYYAVTLQEISGQECSNKEDMLRIIKELDKTLIEKFLKRITIAFDSACVLCLTHLTDTDSFEDSVQALTPTQLWMVWQRSNWSLIELIEPRLIKMLPKLSLQVVWKMWGHCRERGKYFIVEHCAKDFLPLTISFDGPYKRIVESRLKKA